MTVDLDAATQFMAAHARVLDRRRLDVLLGDGDAAGLLGALDGYRNADGGYGWGLEPDLRAPESQPLAALHAFEAFAEAAPLTSAHAIALCDWLASVTLPDGGLPFVLPLSTRSGTAPWFAGADSTVSSLQITAAVVVAALAAARHDQSVAGHPWLDRAVRYCLARCAAIDGRPSAYELAFAVRFLDAAHGTRPDAGRLLGRLGSFIPANGTVHVEGGTAEEFLRPLDFAPFVGTPARALFAQQVIDNDLDRLAGMREQDGGWTVDYAKISPAGALEWRGYATVHAIQILRSNGRL
ncbi:MAG: hypothetical protein ACRDOI_37430 [Trebonia sp.]